MRIADVLMFAFLMIVAFSSIYFFIQANKEDDDK